LQQRGIKFTLPMPPKKDAAKPKASAKTVDDKVGFAPVTI